LLREWQAQWRQARLWQAGRRGQLLNMAAELADVAQANVYVPAGGKDKEDGAWRMSLVPWRRIVGSQETVV